MSWKRMSHEGILALVAHRGGLATGVRAVVAVLGEALPRDDAESIAVELPPGLAEAIRSGNHERPLTAEDFYDRVAALEPSLRGSAREQTQVVLGVLWDELSLYARRRLAAGLPSKMAEAFPHAVPR